MFYILYENRTASNHSVNNMQFKKEFILISKLIALLGLIYFFGFIIKKEIHQAQVRTLNCLMPESYTALLNPSQSSPKALQRYLSYYGIIYSWMPDNADALFIMGFCRYRLGKPAEALRSFKKASALNPRSFWFSYNLGILYFRQGDNVNASTYLHQALTIRPEEILQSMYRSKIYIDIITREGLTPEVLALRLRKCYENGLVILNMIETTTQHMSPDMIAAFRESIDVQIF